jgi:hypothetical protein
VADQPRTSDFTGNSEEVTVDSLESFCARNAIGQIDILKMDVQGWGRVPWSGVNPEACDLIGDQ